MPFVFLLIGILFLVLARNGTQNDFEKLIKSEFSGNQSFLVFASAFVILGLIGFWRTARPVTDAFIGLILFVLIISNKGFFAKLNDAFRNPVVPSTSGGVVSMPTIQTTGSPVPYDPATGALASPLATSVLPN